MLTEELYTILEALNHITNLQEFHFVLFTDTMSALQAFKALFTVNPLVVRIQEQLQQLRLQGKKFTSTTSQRSDTFNQFETSCCCPTFRYEEFLVSFELTLSQRKMGRVTLPSPQSPAQRHNTVASTQHPPGPSSNSRLQLGHSRLTHAHLVTLDKAPP